MHTARRRAGYQRSIVARPVRNRRLQTPLSRGASLTRPSTSPPSRASNLTRTNRSRRPPLKHPSRHWEACHPLPLPPRHRLLCLARSGTSSRTTSAASIRSVTGSDASQLHRHSAHFKSLPKRPLSEKHDRKRSDLFLSKSIPLKKRPF